MINFVNSLTSNVFDGNITVMIKTETIIEFEKAVNSMLLNLNRYEFLFRKNIYINSVIFKLQSYGYKWNYHAMVKEYEKRLNLLMQQISTIKYLREETDEKTGEKVKRETIRPPSAYVLEDYPVKESPECNFTREIMFTFWRGFKQLKKNLENKDKKEEK